MERARDREFPGARWWKFDFHSHTPASEDFGRGPNQADLRTIGPEEWLLSFMRAGLDCVAVTDHDSGDWIDKLKLSLADLEVRRPEGFRPLCLFPGVEVTANFGIHILVLFDPTKAGSDVANFMGAVQRRPANERGARVADASPIEVVERAGKFGGVPILAHVDSANGAWRLSGSTLEPLLKHNSLYAVERVDEDTEPPEIYKNLSPKFAEILGSDCHHLEGEPGQNFPGSRFTWVKMATPNLQSLRMALLDGANSSIQRSDSTDCDDPMSPPKHFIDSIEIAEARYMGRGASPATLRFGPWLNALIGGRGTGKSTVIHALRIASRRGDDLQKLEEHSSPRLTFEQFNQIPRGRAASGGLIDTTSVRMTLVRDGVKHRVTWQHSGTGVVVEDQSNDGQWIESPAQHVTQDRFPLQIFSQGQIAELAKSNQPWALLQVIDDAAGAAALHQKLDEAISTYLALKARIRESTGKLENRTNSLKVEIQDVNRKISNFQASGSSGIIEKFRQANRRQKEIDRQFESIAETTKRINEQADSVQIDDLPDGLFDPLQPANKPVIEAHRGLKAAVAKAAGELRDTARDLRAAQRKQHSTLKASQWAKDLNQISEEHERFVEALLKSGESDPGQYGYLIQERRRLAGEAEKLSSDKLMREELIAQAEEQLHRVSEARRSVTDARSRFLEHALAANRFVRVKVLPFGRNPEPIEQSLREVLGVNDERFQSDIFKVDGNSASTGMVVDLTEDLPTGADAAETIANRISLLKEKIKSAAAGGAKFGGHFNNFLERESNSKPEFLDRIDTWFPEDGLLIEFSRTGDGSDFQPISQASAGQRAAAMLAFLLAYGEEPLVLDQPEDDLDNQLIYDLVVRQMRENKLRRQIIVVTHNANIVVNGDAEMVHVLEFRSGQCTIAQSGCLQEIEIRDEVCRVLEGGREAFERRYRRL